MTEVSPLIETVSKRSLYGSLLSRTLPGYSGPFSVGVSDVELPVPRQCFGTFTHKKFPNREAGLRMDTVLFSVFYPTEDGPSSKHVVWIPKFRQTIDGFLSMAQRTNWLTRAIAYPLAAAAIYGTTFPAKLHSPLRKPQYGKRWPLMIFSHGVGCSRLMYSAFCGEMASRGYICCAVEHRDGTSPSSTIVTEDGKTKTLDWLQWSDLHWPNLDTQPTDDTILRHEQIKMRTAEVYEVIQAMTRLANGENITRTSIHSPDFDWSRWRFIDTSNPIMAGHSLGGCTAIAAGADDRFQLSSIVAFDPAIQRLEPWTFDIKPPLLVINSEEFTRSKDFDRLVKLVKYASSSDIFSISGSTHPAFSDVFLILPTFINLSTGLLIDARKVLQLTVHAVTLYLKGDLERVRKEAREVQGGDKKIEPGVFVYHNV